MSEESSNEKVVYWPRVKELLDGIMAKWVERWGREPLPGIHAYYWETPGGIAGSGAVGHSGHRAGRPGTGDAACPLAGPQRGNIGANAVARPVHAAGRNRGNHRLD